MSVREFSKDRLKVKIFDSRKELGKFAAAAVAGQINNLLQGRNELNMVFAAAPSQNEFLTEFAKIEDIHWSKINAFHMDEYIGIDPAAAHSFGQFLRTRLFSGKELKSVHYINPVSADAQQECKRYAGLLLENPPDIVCLGIGENGHLAFNDPAVANFNDPEIVKIVELDAVCRQQQVNDGCFDTLAEVPQKAITLTIPVLLSAQYLSCVVPGKTKAVAVKKTIENEISTECPSTILRQHNNTVLFLDMNSAQELST